jgi:hypothetical protein
VSGDVVHLRAPAGSIFTRAFEELGAVPAASVRWALIGGLAVSVRLSLAHRATHDVDAMSTHPDDLVELLVRAGGVKSGGLVRLHDVPIDPVPAPGEGKGRLPAARSWAFDGATAVDVLVSDAANERRATARPLVATTAGLVLLKLESSVHAFDRSAAKRATDVYDVLRLFAADVEAFHAEAAHAPRPLRADAAQCARERLLRNPAATLRHFSDVQRKEFTVADLAFYGDALIRALSDGR